MYSKKIIYIFFYLFISINNSNSLEQFKIQISVNRDAITEIDIQNEIKIISLLNKNIKIKNSLIRQEAIKNLIDEKIKKQEIIENNFLLDQKIIDDYYNIFLKNSKIDTMKVEKVYLGIIKEKIFIDMNWNNLIKIKYGWKTYVNSEELDLKIKNIIKETNSEKNIFEIKKKLLEEEKLKKLIVFSKYHLNMLKNNSLIIYN